MSRFDIATGRTPKIIISPPKQEKTLIESLNSLSEWYDHNHFQQLIEELREYCKSTPQIKIEKIHKKVWDTRISVFDSKFNVFFKVHPDYGIISVSQRHSNRNSNIIFKIEKTGKIIGADPNKSRAEIIMVRLLEEALPVGSVEEEIKAEIVGLSSRGYIETERREEREVDEERPIEEQEGDPIQMLRVEQPIVINCTTNISEQVPTNG